MNRCERGRMSLKLSQRPRFYRSARVRRMPTRLQSRRARSAAVAATAGIDMEMTPVRGQMVAVRPPAGWVTHMVVSDAISLIPRVSGSVQIGWTSEHAGFDTRPTLEAIADAIIYARHLMPGLVASMRIPGNPLTLSG